MNDNNAGEKQAKNKKDKSNKLFDSLGVLGANLLESDFVDDMKQGVNDFVKSANSTFASGVHSNSESNDFAKKMIKNLTENLNNSFESNLGLSQECLKCKTVTDYIEIQRKFFEHNYQASVRTYSDFVHDIQQIVNHNMKNTNSCFGK